MTRLRVPVKSTLVQTSRGYPSISTRSANRAHYRVLYGANQGANEVQTSAKVENRSTPAARIDPGGARPRVMEPLQNAKSDLPPRLSTLTSTATTPPTTPPARER